MSLEKINKAPTPAEDREVSETERTLADEIALLESVMAQVGAKKGSTPSKEAINPDADKRMHSLVDHSKSNNAVLEAPKVPEITKPTKPPATM